MNTSILTLSRFSPLAVAALLASSSCHFAIPPGPSPRALAIKRPSTVVVIVQPFSDLEDAEYRTSGVTPQEMSKVTIVEPPGGQGRRYEFLVTEEHVSALNYQLQRADPLMVDLDCMDCPLLFDALATDGGMWSVETSLYYEYDGEILLSTEPGTLRVRNY